MKHGSLFTGIGGFDLAAEWMGWENVFQVEWDKYCQRVLAKNFPNVKRYGDIKEFDGTKYRGLIDIISGGVPCQPSSFAGKRKGEADDRWLWNEMLRVINEIKPPFVVCENPPGILSVGHGKPFKSILSALEDEGYQTELFNIPACSLTAWHKRERIWIISYNSSIRYLDREPYEKSMEGREQTFNETTSSNQVRNVSHSNNDRLQGSIQDGINEIKIRNRQKFTSSEYRPQRERRIYSTEQWTIEPSMGRVANGIPSRVDRLKGLGNAIIPQVAYQIFKVIDELNKVTKTVTQ